MKRCRSDQPSPNWRIPPEDADADLAAEICVAEVEGDFERLKWLLAEQAIRRRQAA